MTQFESFTFPEVILRELRNLYAVKYQDSLTAVKVFWQNHTLLGASESDLPLYDFAERLLVADPSNIGNVSQFPALTMAAGNMLPTSPEFRSQQGEEWYSLQVQLAYMLKGLSQEEVSIMVLRHIQATLHMFHTYPYANLSGLPFQVEGSPSFQPSANALPQGGNALVKGLLVILNIKFAGAGLL